MSDDDLFVLLVTAPFLLPVLTPLFFGMWGHGREWMIERGFIAPPEDAVWAVPGWDGAGIGSVHIVLLVCVVVFVVVIASALARQRHRKRLEHEGWGIE